MTAIEFMDEAFRVAESSFWVAFMRPSAWRLPRSRLVALGVVRGQAAEAVVERREQRCHASALLRLRIALGEARHRRQDAGDGGAPLGDAARFEGLAYQRARLIGLEALALDDVAELRASLRRQGWYPKVTRGLFMQIAVNALFIETVAIP